MLKMMPVHTMMNARIHCAARIKQYTIVYSTWAKGQNHKMHPSFVFHEKAYWTNVDLYKTATHGSSTLRILSPKSQAGAIRLTHLS